MTDKEYNAEKKRIKLYMKKWFNTIGLGWYEVDVDWARGTDPDSPNCAAKVDTQWQYRQANITFYMQNTINLKDEKLESIVVHEFTHILISPLMMVDKSEDLGLQHEFATETIARAIQWARKAGGND